MQDAASTDGTPQWLATQADLSWASEADGGMYDAIGRAWSRATGEVFSWLNSDEQYLPQTLALVESTLNANPGADFVYGNAIIVDSSGQPIASRREIPLRRWYVANGTLYAYSCTLFFRRRLYEQGALRFDKTLRYAADADMVLALLEGGARGVQIKEYLSTFMLDGGNLSCSPRMLEEIALVQRRHRAYPWHVARQAVKACRALEKVVTGAYMRRPLQYRFALDEFQNYKEVKVAAVGGMFDIRQFGTPASVDRK